MSHKKKVSRGRVSTNRVLVAIVLCALVMTTLLTGLVRPAWAAADGSGQSASSTQSRAVTTGANRIADTATYNEYTLGDEDSTQYNGRVWVDKSVSTEEKVSFGNMNVANNSDFLVTYSALATSTIEVGQTPTDTVFILDLSASMTWGYSESGQSVSQGESRLQAMVNAMNSAIDTLVKANPQNRIAIVTFNGSCTAGQALMPTLMTGKEILEQVEDGRYLEIQNYDQHLDVGADKATADVCCAATQRTASTSGGTNIQAGLFRGMGILASNDDTTANVQGTTVTRIPNVILMSDGAPTTFASSENASYVYHRYDGAQEHPDGTRVNGVITSDSGVLRDGNNTVYSGDWWATNSGQQIGAGDNNDPDSADGFMALMTASYFKNAISNKYYPNSDQQANVYTIGFGTDVQDGDMVAMANLVLNPGENLGETTGFPQVNEVSSAWDDYRADRRATVHGDLGDGSNDVNIPFEVEWCNNDSNPTSLTYPTQYFAAANADDLNQIFGQIANLITSSASAPTEVTGDPLSSGYLTYTDTTGAYMEVKGVNKLIFMNKALDVKLDEEKSDSERKVYIAQSYEYSNPAYPGQTFNTNQIEIVIESNTDNTQTITVKIPAALIPLRTNTITLDGNGEPTNNQVSSTLPLRLCYEVGLRDGVVDAEGNLVIGEGGVSEEFATGAIDGKVSFYSNKFEAAQGAENSGVGATVMFEPADANPFYFIQGDTPIYRADSVNSDGQPIDPRRATGELNESAMYYVPVTYYDGAGQNVKRVTAYVARSGATLAGYVENDADGGLYIKDGSPRLGNLEDVTAEKTQSSDGTVVANVTGTYGNYREPTFVYNNQGGNDPHEGHFLVLLGNNGKLTVPLPGPDVQPALRVTKVDASDGQTTLRDATFAVYEDTNNIDGYNKGDTQLGEALKTGSNGVIIFEPDAHTFELGKTYFLVETGAPDGYQLMSGAVSIVFKENDGSDTDYPVEEHPFVATITFPGETSATQYSGPASTGDNPVATVALTVADQPVPSLPQTGGNGRITTAVAGTALVALAGYAFWNKRVRTSHH